MFADDGIIPFIVNVVGESTSSVKIHSLSLIMFVC